MEPLNQTQFIEGIQNLNVDQLELAYLGLAYHRGEVTAKMEAVREVMRAKRLEVIMSRVHGHLEAS